jgi:hypothetical protein
MFSDLIRSKLAARLHKGGTGRRALTNHPGARSREYPLGFQLCSVFKEGVLAHQPIDGGYPYSATSLRLGGHLTPRLTELALARAL